MQWTKDQNLYALTGGFVARVSGLVDCLLISVAELTLAMSDFEEHARHRSSVQKMPFQLISYDMRLQGR
jgi:hypothetical protein